MQPGVEDVVFAFMRFESGLTAHMHLSWLDPHKERRFTVVGSKRMATFDDMELERKLDGLRQGLRRELLVLRRVHRALGRRLLAARLERGAAADRVRALHRVRAGRSRAALGGRVGAARGAGAGAAAAVAGGELACRQALSCRRPSGRRGSCSARASSCRTTSRSAGTWWCTPGPGSAPGRGFRTAAWSASRWRWAARSSAAGREARRVRRASARARRSEPAPWCSRAPRSASAA